ncbi:MAG: mannitol dehydrogenase family protein [Propionibacteriaceae bacterium]
MHVGLGAFHRAHQAWFTAAAADGADWGIAAFTGRSPEAAEGLAHQDGLYTLIERSTSGDTGTIITNLVQAVDGADLDRFVELVAAPSTAIITVTITEAGYRLTPDAQPDPGDPVVVEDIAWLSRVLTSPSLPTSFATGPVTALGRILLGLEVRRRAGVAGLAVVPCDNMPANGEFVGRGLIALAEQVSPETSEWIGDNIAFVSTSVDRITPTTQPEDLLVATELVGWHDRAPVVTEPFRDWVLSGEFPAGRPAWETAGARFVTDILPFERRKLWLLNGSHSLMAYLGLLSGHDTVAAAIADPVCRQWVEDYWDEAVEALPSEGLALPDYRAALIERFENSRIEHRLSQIAINGATKMRVRIAPIIVSERSRGRSGTAAVRALASWIAVVMSEHPPADGEAAGVAAAANQPRESAIGALVRLVDARLADDATVLDLVHSHLATITGDSA